MLIMHLARDAEVEVGRLGVFDFPAGYYLYFGSALNGLHARIDRHMRNTKRLHWHIDYFLQQTTIIDIWCIESEERLECDLCQEVLRWPEVCHPVKGFGSSDCKCVAHLVKIEDIKSIDHFFVKAHNANLISYKLKNLKELY